MAVPKQEGQIIIALPSTTGQISSALNHFAHLHGGNIPYLLWVKGTVKERDTGAEFELSQWIEVTGWDENWLLLDFYEDSPFQFFSPIGPGELLIAEPENPPA